MNVLRRILSRTLLASCLGAALAFGSAAEAQVAFRGPVRMDASSLKPSGPPPQKKPRFDWNEDDSNAELPRVRSETYRHPPARTPVGRGTVRPAAGFVPKHEKVARAQHIVDEPMTPMTETLPAPLDPMGAGAPPNGMGPPAQPRPGMVRPNRRRVINDGTIFSGDELVGEVPFGGDVFAPGAQMGPGGCSNCEGEDCQTCGGPEYMQDCYPCFNLKNLEVFTGVFGFTNPTNRAGAGSFGYAVGVNKGRPMLCFPCSSLAMQFGVAGNFSNFDGAAFANGAALANTPDSRNQLFLTGGIFRRVDWGLQGGVVFDYLHDDWFSTADLGQIRGEASWVYPYRHEIGFWFATSVNGSNQNGRVFVGAQPVIVNEVWEATDMYSLFYRRRFERGGEGRIFGGFTGDGDGLFGSDFFVPLTGNWGIQGGYTYLLPKDDNRVLGNANEAWNVMINFVWTPGLCRDPAASDYNRPLLPVANNGNFIVKRRLLP